MEDTVVDTDRLGSSSLDPQDPRDPLRKRTELDSPVMVDVIDLTAFELDYDRGVKKGDSFQSALQDSMAPQVGGSTRSRLLDKKGFPAEVQVIRISSTEEREVIKVPSNVMSEDGMEVKELISLRSESQVGDSWNEEDTQILEDAAVPPPDVTQRIHEIISVHSDLPKGYSGDHATSHESFQDLDEREMRSQHTATSSQDDGQDESSEVLSSQQQAQEQTQIHDLTSVLSDQQMQDAFSVKTDQQAQDIDSLQFRSMVSQEKPPDEVDIVQIKSSHSNPVIQKSLTLPAIKSEKPAELDLRNVLSDQKDPPESPGRSIYLRAIREGRKLAELPTISNPRSEKNNLSETAREGRRSFLLTLMAKAGKKYSQLAFHDLSHINKVDSAVVEGGGADSAVDEDTTTDGNNTKDSTKEGTVGDVNNVLHVIGTFEETQYGTAPKEEVAILRDSSHDRNDDDEGASTGAVYSGADNETEQDSEVSVTHEIDKDETDKSRQFFLNQGSDQDDNSIVESAASVVGGAEPDEKAAETRPSSPDLVERLSASVVDLLQKTFSRDGHDTDGGGCESEGATSRKPLRLFGGPDSRYRSRDPPERAGNKVQRRKKEMKDDNLGKCENDHKDMDSDKWLSEPQDFTGSSDRQNDLVATEGHGRSVSSGFNEPQDFQIDTELPRIGSSPEQSINLVASRSALDGIDNCKQSSMQQAVNQGPSLDRLADRKKEIMEEILSKVKRDNTFVGSDKDSDIEDALLPALKKELTRMRQIYSKSSRNKSPTGLVRTCLSDQTSDKGKSMKLDMQDFRETVMRRTGPDANVGVTQSVLELINDDDDHLAEDKNADFDNLTLRYSHDLAVGEDDSMSSGTEDMIEEAEDQSVDQDDIVERHERMDEDERTQDDDRTAEHRATSEQQRSVVVESVAEDSEESGSDGANVSRDSRTREEWQDESNSDSKASIVDSISSESELDLYENSAFPYVVRMLDKSCAWLEGEDFMCGFQSRPSLLRKARKQVANEKKYQIEKANKKKSLPSRAVRNPVLAKTIRAKKEEPPGKRRILPSRRELIKDPKNESVGFDTRGDGQQQTSMFVRPRRSRASSPKSQTPEEVKQEIKEVLSSLTPFQQKLRHRLDSIKIRDSVSEHDHETERGDSTIASQVEESGQEFDIEQAQRDLKLAAMELEKFGEIDVRNAKSSKSNVGDEGEQEFEGPICVEPSDTRDEQESGGSQDENRHQGGNVAIDLERNSSKCRGLAGGPEVRTGVTRSWRRDPPISIKDNARNVDPPEESAPPEQEFNALNEEERLAALDLTEKLRRRAATLKRRRRLRERRMKHLQVLQTRSGSASE